MEIQNHIYLNRNILSNEENIANVAEDFLVEIKNLEYQIDDPIKFKEILNDCINLLDIINFQITHSKNSETIKQSHKITSNFIKERYAPQLSYIKPLTFSYKDYSFDIKRNEHLFKDFKKNTPITHNDLDRILMDRDKNIDKTAILKDIIEDGKQEEYYRLESILIEKRFIFQDIWSLKKTKISFCRFYTYLKYNSFLKSGDLETNLYGIKQLAKIYDMSYNDNFKTDKRTKDYKSDLYLKFARIFIK